jgi:hypothetical protein
VRRNVLAYLSINEIVRISKHNIVASFDDSPLCANGKLQDLVRTHIVVITLRWREIYLEETNFWVKDMRYSRLFMTNHDSNECIVSLRQNRIQRALQQPNMVLPILGEKLRPEGSDDCQHTDNVTLTWMQPELHGLTPYVASALLVYLFQAAIGASPLSSRDHQSGTGIQF